MNQEQLAYWRIHGCMHFIKFTWSKKRRKNNTIFTVIKAPSPRWNALLQNVSLSIFVKQDVIDFVLIRPLDFVYFFLWLNELKQINRWLQTILKLSEN